MKLESPTVYARQIWDAIRNASDTVRPTPEPAARPTAMVDNMSTEPAKPRAPRRRKTTK